MTPKTVLITGASKGIGFTIAKHLANNDQFEVYGTSRNPDQDLVTGHNIKLLPLDLNSDQSIMALVEKFPDGVDVLINNAGQSQLGAFEDIPQDKFQQLFQTNFFGSLNLTRALLPAMRKKKKGLIINISSLIASFPLPYYTSYTASKAAFSAFSFSLNMELKPQGINVVVVEPNDLKTSIEPTMFLPEDSAYQKPVRMIREKVRSNMSKSEDPAVVLKVIDKIINASNPAPKYVVGGNAGFLVFIKRLLTSGMQLKLTGKSYKE